MELYTAISLNLTIQPHIYTTCLNGTSLKTNSQVDVIQTHIDYSYTISIGNRTHLSAIQE